MIEALLHDGKGYVLGVASNRVFHTCGKPQLVSRTASAIAQSLLKKAGRHLPSSKGTKGPRLHDWAYVESRHERIQCLGRIANLYRLTRPAALEHDRAKAELKTLVPQDAREAAGHGLRAKRSKSGAISFELLVEEAGHAALQQ